MAMTLLLLTLSQVTFHRLIITTKPFTGRNSFMPHLASFVFISGTCPPNWVHILRSCYRFSYDKLEWSAAKSACEKLGSKLTVVNSEAEQKALVPKVPYASWIGLRRFPWVWVNGSRLSYSNWNDGEPNNWNNEEECVEMNPSSAGQWNDRNCNGQHYCICKKKADK